MLESLVATAIGLALAAGFCHTLLAHLAEYRAHVSRMEAQQESRFALRLMLDELRLALWGPQGAGCPGSGVHLTESGIAFIANLYDRTTELKEAVDAGSTELAVARAVFDPHDLVRIVDVGRPADPSDDHAQCVRLVDVAGTRLTGDRALAYAFPIKSTVTALNLISYAHDARGRGLMRSQDGGRQRIASKIETFSAEWIDNGVAITISAHPDDGRPIRWQRRIAWGEAP